MEFYHHPPELSPPPPEPELRPELELTAPPPEFGQGSGPQEAPSGGKRSLRKLLAIPAILLSVSLFVHQGKPSPAAPDQPEPVPVETAAPVAEGVPGSVVLDVSYAVRDADTVRYSYTVYTPVPSLDAAEEQIAAYHGPIWPVSVYARVSDEAGHVIAPLEDPDVWEDSRADCEYSLDSTGLEGELKLTLTAVYTEEGEERRTQAEFPLPALPPAPESAATLTLLESSQVDYSAVFRPLEEDAHSYDLLPVSFTLVWFDAAGEPCDERQLLDADTLPSLEADPAGGFAAAYQGPAALERPSEAAERFCARLVLRDRSTGYPYRIDSNILELPAEPILSGRLEAFPGGVIDAEFRFLPPPGDERDYKLQVVGMGQEAFYEGEQLGFSLGDDHRSMPVTGDNESGYTVRYHGGSAAASIPEGAQLLVYAILEDLNTGERWTIPTNRVDAVEPLPPEYATYPLGDGKITITVYNDTPDFQFPSAVETDSGLTILALETMPESEFSSYVLPAAYTPDGYDFAGWVVHVNNPMDLSSNADLFSEYNGDPPLEALTGEDTYAFTVIGTLTKEDVERVPPSEDGVRYVNVHAVWICQSPEAELILLDDGAGKVAAYGMESPIYSEGYLYLCNYPVPDRPGMVFDGWYDDEGNRVDLLVCYFSFYPMLYNEDGSFAGYDWGSYQPVHLTAHWKTE